MRPARFAESGKASGWRKFSALASLRTLAARLIDAVGALAARLPARPEAVERCAVCASAIGRRALPSPRAREVRDAPALLCAVRLTFCLQPDDNPRDSSQMRADEDNEREHTMTRKTPAQQPAPNPIVRTTQLRAYPGWEIREYADGTFDAAHRSRPAMSPAERSFADALYFVKHDEPAPR